VKGGVVGFRTETRWNFWCAVAGTERLGLEPEAARYPRDIAIVTGICHPMDELVTDLANLTLTRRASLWAHLGARPDEIIDSPSSAFYSSKSTGGLTPQGIQIHKTPHV
jgi:hypothetical protein